MPGILTAYHQDHLTGVAATGSNLCLGGDRLFVHDRRQVPLRWTSPTGSQAGRVARPRRVPTAKPGTWGFIACDGSTLFGSLVNQEHVVKESWRSFLGKLDMSRLFSESMLLFALDARTGKLKWTFTPEHSMRHNAIALGCGRVYLIDRPLAAGDAPQRGPRESETGPPRGPASDRRPGPSIARPVACLDAQSGGPVGRPRRRLRHALGPQPEPRRARDGLPVRLPSSSTRS